MGMPASALPPQESSVLPGASSSSAPAAAPVHFPLRRLVFFVGIVGSILLVTTAFVCATAAYFFNLRGWFAWQAVPDLVALAFIAATLLGFSRANPLLRVIYAISASWLGALNFAFFASVACWIAAGIVWLTGAPVPRADIALGFYGLALLVTLYGLVNAAWLRTTRVTVHLANLPEAWRGRTAALVTDLHLGHVSGPAFLRRVVSRLRKLNPDIVFISGDLFDGTTADLDRLIAPWSEFSAPRGIYYVTGNHDEFAGRAIYINAVKRTGVQVLDNEKITVQGLQLVGVHDSEAGDPGELRDILRRAAIDRHEASILLAHQPANLAIVEEEGIGLQLSGHTHSGQIWPWNRMVARIWGRFAYGLNRLGTLQVYTSSGAGTWGPPLRVATKAEVVLIRFEK
jgi:predicted MPP superfamily phosphohydrolase